MKNKFELFKKECLQWIDKWELNNYTYRFFKGLTKRHKENYSGGVIERYLQNGQCDVYFEEKDHKTDEDVKKTAKHEIIHSMLLKIYQLGRSRQFTFDEYEREEEELVHKLEKLL